MPDEARTPTPVVADATAPEGHLVGRTHRKVDAMERMRGVLRYTDDLKLPGMLHGKIKRSPHAHARIVSIDASAALAMPGVFAVVTGQDFEIPYGIIPWTPDENALALTKALFVGDGVAAVAAIDEDTAIAACDAIRVEYEPLPAIYDPEAALAAPPEQQINPYAKKGNLSKEVLLELSSDGGEQPARAADEARATNETNAVRTFMGPPDVGALGATPR